MRAGLTHEMPKYMWRGGSEKNLWKLVLSFRLVGTRGQIQVVFYLWSHFSGLLARLS